MTTQEQTFFRSARPLWPEGMDREKNLLVGFRAEFDAAASAQAVLRVAASTLYRAWLNGEFLGHGPARGPHGHFPVDQWPLAPGLLPGRNLLAICRARGSLIRTAQGTGGITPRRTRCPSRPTHRRRSP